MGNFLSHETCLLWPRDFLGFGEMNVVRTQVNQALAACQFRRTLNDDGEDSEEQPSINLFCTNVRGGQIFPSLPAQKL